MRTADRLSDDFPHGTVDGYRAGCRTSACPAALPCRDVYRRYAGDYVFRRLVDAGVPLAEILDREAEEREAIEQRDRAANRAGRKRPQPKPTRATPRATAHAQVRTPAPASTAEVPESEKQAAEWRARRTALYATLRAAERAVEEATAARDRATVAFDAHVAAGEPTAPVASAPRNGRRRRRDEIEAGVRRLQAEGKADAAVAVALGITRAYAGIVRRELGLPSNVPAGGQKAVA
jgi:HAMP domain-containing protein